MTPESSSKKQSVSATLGQLEFPVLDRSARLVLQSGLYSRLSISQDEIVKTIVVGDASAREGGAHDEAHMRTVALVRYQRRLESLGVCMPKTRIEESLSELGAPTIEMVVERIPNATALVTLPLAAAGDQYQFVACITREMTKVIHSQYGEMPVGYDSGFDNFILYGGCCYLIDIYPPRLGYLVRDDGCIERLPPERLLVNYPEVALLPPGKIAELQRCYYTPEGTAEHIAVWAIATACARQDLDAHGHWWRLESAQSATEAVYDTLRHEGFARSVDPLHSFLSSVRGTEAVRHRHARVQSRFAPAFFQWESICNLFSPQPAKDHVWAR